MQCNVDNMAAFLTEAAQMALNMPPAWDGGALSQPIATPGGGRLGRMLPGKGVYLDMDLKAVGIDKPIHGVFERSNVMRAWDQFGKDGIFDERVAIGYAQWCKWNRIRDDEGSKALAAYRSAVNIITTGYDGIINGRANGKTQDYSFTKLSATTVASLWHSLGGLGGNPAALTYTAIPGGAVMINTNAGALSLGLTNPTNPDKKYLLTFGFGSTVQVNWVVLADLLVAASGINANIATSQTVNTTAETRTYNGTLGAGVQMTMEVTVALGATAANVTHTYTNQSGTASRSTGAIAMSTSCIVGRTQPATLGLPTQLQTGDWGVRSVESTIFSAAMLAGTLALHLYVPLMYLPGVTSNAYIERDSTVQIDGLEELVVDGSNVLGCLITYILPSTTSSGIVNAFFRTVAA